MKVLYSQLKKYLPDLKATPREVGNVYTITGFMLDKFFEVEVNGQKDYLLDLEVRQNRADSFGVQGLAKELSAYYNIPLEIPKHQIKSSDSNYNLPIQVKAEKAVKRIMAIKISDLKVDKSPEWLVEYLKAYDINSINNLVDLTNYVMLETGHPSHAFDTKVSGDNLIWELANGEYPQITTLNGEEVILNYETLLISNGEKPLSLSIIGGLDCAINFETNEIVLEMAIYDGGLIRRNSRSLRVITEASQRLEKYLDADSIPDAFAMLANMIIENCGGKITSKIYDNYLQPTPKIEIDVDLDKVSQIAGIEISYDESKTYLQRLGFTILADNGNSIKVLRPVNRLDISLEEDAFEEIIRLKGFDKIPTNNVVMKATRDITPKHLKVIDEITNKLPALGYDEVRSWVLVSQESNAKANWENWEEIVTTNSINEEAPALRQTLTVSIIAQAETFEKNMIPDIKLFEIGKSFGKTGNDYSEHYSVAMLSKNDINSVKNDVLNIITGVGIENVTFVQSKLKMPIAHPSTSWIIKSGNENVGVLFTTNELHTNKFSVCELDLDKLINLASDAKVAKEVSSKIVSLDANVLLDDKKDIVQHMDETLKSNSENIWKYEIIDVYKTGNEIKYTVRVNYLNLSDTEAKELHAGIFGV